ncbi:MAG: M48 family metallopeptidase [Candidatus Omnitrophota bacterium]|nr:MAG: M48 family metallopeptidase [Candidatus Omnitrophota bacterium]
MNIYLVIILLILIGECILSFVVESLNVKHARSQLPEEFSDTFDAERYKRSQEYLRENTHFELKKEIFLTVIIVAFILIGGFNFVDQIARSSHHTPIVRGLIFAGILMFSSQILSIPFSAYRTFVIEEKYGFNKTTPKTFIADLFKRWLLTALIGGIMLAAVIWFFGTMGNYAWLYCWVAITIFELFLVFIAPVLILPLFNKFIPLEEGELKNTIENYAKSQRFALKGVFTMDASRRSTKSNAFFTGFGKYRRIALFDTLIQKHTVDELVSVLAHEIGHYKKKHILKDLVLSVAIMGLMFFILSFFINNEGLFGAFKMEELSVYASLVFFGFLYSPIHFVFSVVQSIISRKHEYEADVFAVTTYKNPHAFIAALKRLTADNLSNLTPHPLKVFLYYSHPPVLQRIQAIRAMHLE